jgi:hypothetical protein
MGCGSVCMTRYIAVVGILVSGLCIAPPAFTHASGRDPSTLLPGLKILQVFVLMLRTIFNAFKCSNFYQGETHINQFISI